MRSVQSGTRNVLENFDERIPDPLSRFNITTRNKENTNQ